KGFVRWAIKSVRVLVAHPRRLQTTDFARRMVTFSPQSGCTVADTGGTMSHQCAAAYLQSNCFFHLSGMALKRGWIHEARRQDGIVGGRRDRFGAVNSHW